METSEHSFLSRVAAIEKFLSELVINDIHATSLSDLSGRLMFRGVKGDVDFVNLTDSSSVKCEYCRQWTARKEPCKYCGAPA